MMEKIFDRQFMELLKTLSIRINMSLKSGNLGSKRSKASGSSVEFSDYREYMPGDDFRRIDWNAYARFEKVFIKLFMQEQESQVTIFMDTSRSMLAKGKRQAAIKVAGTFAYSALADYDRVSILPFSCEIGQPLSGLSGGKSFNRVISHLEEYPFSGESDLYQSIYSWQGKMGKGISIIITDLMYDHQLDKLLRLLAFKKQRVVLCHVLSEEELNPVFDENVQLIDSESGEKLDIDAGYTAINLYKNKLQAYLKEIKANCSKYGVDYIMINAQVPIESFIKKIQSIS